MILYMPMFRNVLKFQYFQYFCPPAIRPDQAFPQGPSWQALPVLQPSFLVISIQLRPIGTILTGSHIVLSIDPK